MSFHHVPRARCARAGAWLAVTVIAACTPAQQKPVLETALDSREQREVSFEAMLRVLDERPEYVREFFTQAQRHPETLRLLLRITAQHLHEEELAQMTAAELTAAPRGLQTVLVASLDAMQDDPAAMNAAAAAIAARPAETARMLVQRDDAVRKTLHELVEVVLQNSRAAETFRESLAENSDQLSMIITKDPELTGVLFKSIAKAGLKRGKNEFQSFLRAYSE